MPLIKAGIAHCGAALIDVISPCVAFNNHPGSTKSYDFVREHNVAVNKLDFIPIKAPIETDYEEGKTKTVKSHNGEVFKLRKLKTGHEPKNRISAINNLEICASKGEILTGLIFEDSR